VEEVHTHKLTCKVAMIIQIYRHSSRYVDIVSGASQVIAHKFIHTVAMIIIDATNWQIDCVIIFL